MEERKIFFGSNLKNLRRNHGKVLEVNAKKKKKKSMHELEGQVS